MRAAAPPPFPNTWTSLSSRIIAFDRLSRGLGSGSIPRWLEKQIVVEKRDAAIGAALKISFQLHSEERHEFGGRNTGGLHLQRVDGEPAIRGGGDRCFNHKRNAHSFF